MLTSQRLSCAVSRLKPVARVCARGASASSSPSSSKPFLFNESVLQPHLWQKFELEFIGTGTFPTPWRSTACTILNLGSEAWVFDAGDGTVRQIQHCSFKHPLFSRVFISRLDPLHAMGLPMLLHSEIIKNVAAPLHIYGPEGLAKFVYNSMLPFQKSFFRPLVVHELCHSFDFASALQPTPAIPSYKQSYVPHDDSTSTSTPQDEVEGFKVIKLFPEPSGFWRIVDSPTIAVLANTVDAPAAATFGFVVREVPRQGTLRISECNRLGVDVSQYHALKIGQWVKVPGRDALVRPEEVLEASQGWPRKVTIVSAGVDSSSLLPAAQHSDVVVHSASLNLMRRPELHVVDSRGLTNAVSLAQEAQAFTLAFTRFVTTLGAIRGGEQFMRKQLAMLSFPLERMLLTRDHMRLTVPAGGLKAAAKRGEAFSVSSVLSSGYTTSADEPDGLPAYRPERPYQTRRPQQSWPRQSQLPRPQQPPRPQHQEPQEPQQPQQS